LDLLVSSDMLFIEGKFAQDLATTVGHHFLLAIIVLRALFILKLEYQSLFKFECQWGKFW
jgi:hypothetical protein